MNYLLHIDTSTDTGTVMIGANGNLLYVKTNDETRNHASTLNLMINEVLADAQISMNDLAGIVVCAGPGSYTGLRIGMATAKGICYTLNKPLFLDNKLTLLAYEAWARNSNFTRFISLLRAREKEYFIAIYDDKFRCTLLPAHIMEGQLKSLIEKNENNYFITNVEEDVIQELIGDNSHIETNVTIPLLSWAFYSFEQYKCNNSVNLLSAEPFYLKQVYTHN